MIVIFHKNMIQQYINFVNLIVEIYRKIINIRRAGIEAVSFCRHEKHSAAMRNFRDISFVKKSGIDNINFNS